MVDETLTRSELQRDCANILHYLEACICLGFPAYSHNKQDISHDVFYIMWNKASTFRRECSLLTYAKAVLSNYLYSRSYRLDALYSHVPLDERINLDSKLHQVHIDLRELHRREMYELINKTPMPAHQRSLLHQFLSDTYIAKGRNPCELNRAVNRLRKTLNLNIPKRPKRPSSKSKPLALSASA